MNCFKCTCVDNVFDKNIKKGFVWLKIKFTDDLKWYTFKDFSSLHTLPVYSQWTPVPLVYVYTAEVGKHLLFTAIETEEEAKRINITPTVQ